MSVLVWTGDHSKSSAERLRLMNSKIYNALDLGRFPKNSAHTKYVVVPALSKRVWLGSAFKHLKFSEGEIQALVHWRSEDSIRIYGRMDEIYQMNAREKAASASFTVMNASSLPRIDPVAYNDRNEIILPDVVRIASQINIDA